MYVCVPCNASRTGSLKGVGRIILVGTGQGRRKQERGRIPTLYSEMQKDKKYPKVLVGNLAPRKQLERERGKTQICLKEKDSMKSSHPKIEKIKVLYSLGAKKTRRSVD